MKSGRRVAAIDVGTNTVLLLVVEFDGKTPKVVVERATITRLGEGVDRTGRLLSDAMRRTTACLEGYAALAVELGVVSLDAVCTSAARDAENGREFIELATWALGCEPRIIEGEAEARLTFDGAITGLDLDGDVTVFDIGGGSTEIIRGTVNGTAARIQTAVSMNVGTVRLTERHIANDPPLPIELAKVRKDVSLALATVPRFSTSELVGVAGTVTTLAAIHLGLPIYDSSLVHGSTLRREVVEELATRLAALPLEERRTITGLEPARADVIVAGAHLVLAVLDWSAKRELRVSDRGVRWGVALAALRG